MNRKKVFIIKLCVVFSTLVGYWIFLAFFSRDGFLDRWISGSFALFVALVIANIIRAADFREEDDKTGGGDGRGE